MNSFGQILRETRESKKISIEKAESETSIARRYIEALESEKVEQFPGSSYLTGFLRNYSEYLGLDSTKMISLFRAKIIQESPVPIALTKPFRSKYLAYAIAIPIVVVLGVGAGLWVYFSRLKAEEFARANEIQKNQDEQVYRLVAGQELKERFFVGDKIIISHNNDDVTLKVNDTLSILTLETPLGEQFVDNGEEIELDIDGEPGGEIIVFLSDISNTQRERGAEAKFIYRNSEAVAHNASLDANTEDAFRANVSSIAAVLIDDKRAYPFTVLPIIRTPVVIRYQSDNQDRREDFFYESTKVVISANNRVRIWCADDNALKMQVVAGGKSIDVASGKKGQVSVRDIKWIRSSSGGYQLVVQEID
ncbi:MAG: helix-turn-helix domain-containing protein [Treponemataceae bacterium]|nr:MAG: helix-turn-helix domain-containing protein [Treponemataceae bacterium]